MPKDNIQLLVNEQATGEALNMALLQLKDACKEGEQAIIFFSGHSDVKAKLLNLGLLLCWDAPPLGYLNGGSIAVDHLQLVVNALTLQNEAALAYLKLALENGFADYEGVEKDLAWEQPAKNGAVSRADAEVFSRKRIRIDYKALNSPCFVVAGW